MLTDVSVCSVCHLPAHASETDDLDRCEDCQPYAPREWLVTYETAEMSRHQTENAAWLAHTCAFLRGLNPDSLAVVEVPARCGGCRSLATRRDAYDVADVCSDCGEESDHEKAERLKREKRAADREET
jgi:hypothetical protein